MATVPRNTVTIQLYLFRKGVREPVPEQYPAPLRGLAEASFHAAPCDSVEARGWPLANAYSATLPAGDGYVAEPGPVYLN